MARDRFQHMIECVGDYAIVTLSPDGRVETWNHGAELINGYERADMIGQTLHVLYTPEDLASGKPDTLFEEALEKGRVEDEGWRVRKDGTRFLADVVISVIRDEARTLVGFVAITRDLTRRRHAEERRAQEVQRYRTLVETARDYAIFMLDTSGHVATWNAGAERIKGWTADEIIGQHFSRFYPEDDVRAGKCEHELDRALHDGRFEDEGWRVRKDGSRFWANVVIAPLRDAAGEHIGFSKITRDLTERRNAELDRVRLVKAEEALRLRDEFLSIASHELRTPLVALKLQIESLQAQGARLDSKQMSKLDRAGRNVQRLEDLISALLDVARIARGKLTLNPKPIDLGVLICDVIDRLQEPAHDAKCMVVTDLEPHIEGVWDPLRIGQVVTNLLSNAFRYAAGSRVAVKVTRDGAEAVITVQDRGPGIAPEDLERVFERFERAAPARNYGGMGLGLYVAREIVSAHGGVIHARNRAGGGAELEVRLPIRQN